MKSEEDKMIDNFLRESLGNYQEQPAPKVWQGIVQKLPYKPLGKYFPTSDGGILFTLIGGLVITAGLAYFFAGNLDSKASREVAKQQPITEKSEKVSMQENGGNENTAESSMGADNTTNYSAVVLKDETEPAIANPISTSKNVKTSQAKGKTSHQSDALPVTRNSRNNKNQAEKQNASIPNATKNSRGTENAKLASLEKENTVPIASQPLTFKPSAMFSLKANNAFVLAETNKTFYAELLRNQASENFMKVNQNRMTEYFPSRGTYCITAFYRPEFLNGEAGELYAAQRNTAGLSLRYAKMGLLLETGIEFTKESRKQDFNVQYYEFLGTYQNLDSIGFVQQGNQLVADYYYSTDSVYNPELSVKKTGNTATYSFVRIPLLVGMERQWGHFSYGLKAGVMLGILTGKQVPVFRDFNPDARIFSLENTSPAYKNTNVQWVLKADLDWNINTRFGLNLAPAINAYLTDPYTHSKNKTKSPLYWGIQAGVFYKW